MNYHLLISKNQILDIASEIITGSQLDEFKTRIEKFKEYQNTKATLIQSFFRGYKSRKIWGKGIQQVTSVLGIYSGFFSNCSVLLHNIVYFINKYEMHPNNINTDRMFELFFNNLEHSKDIKTKRIDNFFQDFHLLKNIKIKHITKIDYHQEHQYKRFRDLDFDNLTPLIKRYFSPCEKIKQLIKEIENKYHIDYENICVLFYRGNDKANEMFIPSYERYYEEAKKVLDLNPSTIFLIQSDETEFIDFFSSKYPNNSFFFKDEIRHMTKRKDSVDKIKDSDYSGKNLYFSQYFLAITIIMSKCKTILCTKGNCPIWIILFRGHCAGVHQWISNRNDSVNPWCVDMPPTTKKTEDGSLLIEVNEREFLKMKCNTKILSAKYGTEEKFTIIPITEEFSNNCKNGIRVSNQIVGDPHPCKVKKLSVCYIEEKNTT